MMLGALRRHIHKACRGQYRRKMVSELKGLPGLIPRAHRDAARQTVGEAGRDDVGKINHAFPGNPSHGVPKPVPLSLPVMPTHEQISARSHYTMELGKRG